MNIIRVRNLSKSFQYVKRKEGLMGHLQTLFSRQYATKHAVQDLSFDITRGSITGIIGPNGAGKSTLIKILTGILASSSGEVQVLNIDPFRKRIANARRIGVVFGQRTQLYWDLPLQESFNLTQYIYQIAPETFRHNLQYLTDLFELKDLLDVPVRKLSLGQRLRGDLSLILLHDPEIIYLDEPTIGLDILAKDRLRKHLLRINQEKKTTIILTTHDLFDLEKLCQRLIIMDKGGKLYDDQMDAFLRARQMKKTLIIDFENEAPSLIIQKGTIIKKEFTRVWIDVPTGENIPAIISEILERHTIVDLMVHEPAIEEIVKDIYEKIS